jgi:Transposase DNA-binding
MEALIPLRSSFGMEHFGAAQLGDARLTRRLIRSADAIFAHPHGTLPQKMKGHAPLTGLYRLLNAPAVTHAAVIAPHAQRTRQRIREHGDDVVLLIHDATELDYTSKRSLEELGEIGGGGGRGYISHHTLAVTPRRQVLGLLSQILHRRRPVAKARSKPQKRDDPNRESRLWIKGVQACGVALDGQCCVDITDRGGDCFEFAAFEVRLGRSFVIRSAYDRALAGLDHVGADRIHDHLHAYARDLPDLGKRALTLPPRPMGRSPGRSKHKARPGRSIAVRIAAGPITIKAPKPAHGESFEKQLDLWVIHVKEASAPPAGEDPVEWVLLSNVAVGDFAQACERVDWYGCRWVIEEFHKAIKSGGCNVQELQLREESRLEPMIAILSVTAAALMELRHLARDPQTQTQPARQVLPVLYVKVLSAWRHRVVNAEMSCHDFCMALARLGGHLNRKSDGFPGWQTLWRGWEELQIMTAAVEAMDEARKCVES